MNTWDEAKRVKTLAERGLDFADAELVFKGPNDTQIDDRVPYGEVRYITAGWLRGRFVIVVWTPRDGGRRIISMRHGHDKERRRHEALGRSR
ncbi:BrnT family toxin [uncultured Rhodospira sp.]|uniref:BrnT family toxin n=1 Tax=uncultured Rhodospira sp. TaxID=1936189 RepID=UPI00262C2D2B|nr:BrnT family toxin [uncultured Rhodospira sp.]